MTNLNSPDKIELKGITEPVIKKAVESTVSLHIEYEGGESNITGVHVGDGKIYTVAHALKNRKIRNIQVVDATKKEWENPLVEMPGNLDLAILQLDKFENKPHVEVKNHVFEPGETVLVVAFPRPHFSYLTRGVYVNDYPKEFSLPKHLKEDYTTDFSFIFQDLVDPKSPIPMIFEGASGSGVYTTKGDLVGLVVAKLANKEGQISPYALALRLG